MTGSVARPEIALPEGAEIGACLRHVPGKHSVFRGNWRGRPAILRVATPETAGMQAREWREACRIWPVMQGVRFRVAEPLAYVPEYRLVVMAEAPGVPLFDHLRHVPVAQHGACLAPAAAWLRRYTEVSESWRAAQPEGWLARAERAAATQPVERLRRIEEGLVETLHRLAPAIAGTEWRMAICHGDFHANNLVADGPRLTGIDTGGSARMPVARDIARFLMHLARRGVAPSGQTWCGVDRGLSDAFAEAFALTGWERRQVLPFFLGVEALLRVETHALPPRRLRIAARVYTALRDDLSRAGGPVFDSGA